MAFSERIALPYRYERPLPDFQQDDDIKFPDALVEHFLERFTRPGDNVLDPFAGLGTTFFVCETMGRTPFGMEADEQRFAWVSERIKTKNNLKYGDSIAVAAMAFPPMDFCLASPPYMPRNHKWNPLYNGDPTHDGYDKYLSRMQDIYRAVRKVVKPGAPIVVQADNLTQEGFSPLVWDLGNALSDIMVLEGEVLAVWSENKENDSAFTQCLVFRNVDP